MLNILISTTEFYRKLLHCNTNDLCGLKYFFNLMRNLKYTAYSWGFHFARSSICFTGIEHTVLHQHYMWNLTSASLKTMPKTPRKTEVDPIKDMKKSKITTQDSPAPTVMKSKDVCKVPTVHI